MKRLKITGQQIQLVLGVGNEIWLPGKCLPHAADRGGHMLDAVQYHPVLIDKENVAVLSHDLDDEGLLTEIPHFVQMLRLNAQDALQAGLGDAQDPAVLNVLSKEHTEIGGRQGALLVVPCQIRQGEGGVRGEQEPFLTVPGLYREKQFVRLRLGDLIDPSAGELPV